MPLKISKKKLVNLFISLVVAGVVIYVFISSLSELSWDQLLMPFRTLRVHYLILAVFFFFVTYIGRTTRFITLLQLPVSTFYRLLGVVNLQNFYNMMLPARTGELTFLYLCKRYLLIDITKSSASLILARMADLLLMAFFLTLSILFYIMDKRDSSVSTLLVVAVISLGVLIFCFIFIKEIMAIFLRVALFILKPVDRIISGRLKREHILPIAKVEEKLPEWLSHLAINRHFKVFTRNFISTILVWIGIYGYFYFGVMAFDFDTFAKDTSIISLEERVISKSSFEVLLEKVEEKDSIMLHSFFSFDASTGYSVKADLVIEQKKALYDLLLKHGLINEFNLLTTIIGSSGATISYMLPINPPGGAGPWEAGWVVVFWNFLGWDVKVAIVTGIWSHLWVLISAAFFAAVSWVMFRFSKHSAKLE